MALDFPSNPVNGQVYDNFIYDASKGTWKSLSSGASPNYLVNPTITNAVITATAPTSSTVPLTVNGATSQSANLQEWKNSSAVTVLSVNNLGEISAPSISTTGLNINRTDASSEGGQISLRRSIDNANYWNIDVSGNTTTPSLRFFHDIAGYTPGLIIDSSGRPLTPNRPAFCARGVSNTGGGDRTLLFNQTIDFNVGSHYNSSTGRFTAPIAGIYFFEFHLFATAGSRYLGNISKNGAGWQEYTQEQPNGAGTSQGYGSLDGKIVISLAANDYVTVTATATILGTSSIYTSFSGYLVG
jgi:hypothetical protein